MNYFWNRHNLFYRICANALILLHLVTFGPIREALAFSASSINYKLTAGTLNEGGKSRTGSIVSTDTNLLLHCDGADGSTSITDETGKIVSGAESQDSYTKLMLHMNGSGASFTDTATAKAITSQGSVTQVTDQKKFGSASALFDGAGDYLSASDSDDWNLGSGNFTIDTWVRFNSLTDASIACQKQDDNNFWEFQYSPGDRQLVFRIVSGGSYTLFLACPWTSNTNTWYHLALSRVGSGDTADSWRIFVDGQAQALTKYAGNYSAAIADLSSNLTIGSFGGNLYYLNGWLDELRISKGIARWTTNFTVPAYEYGSGQVEIDTAQSKFGGASVLFNGTGDYLTVADSDDWNFGTGNFTVDFWARFNDVTSKQGLVGQYDALGTLGWAISYEYYLAAGHLYFILQDYQTVPNYYFEYPVEWMPSTNTWHHIALVRTGSTFKFFVDGVQVGNDGSSALPVPNATSNLWIGWRGDAGASKYFNGWLDELRISKGIARWTANFTPPTEPYILSSEIPNANKLWQDVIGESCAGRAQSTNYVLSAGFIPTIQSNPPVLTQSIPYQSWAMNFSKANALDLDDYFTSPEGYPLTYSASGNSKINIAIDPATHIVSFSQPQDWTGVEKVYFLATDSEGATIQSNLVALQVENAGGLADKPVIAEITLTPAIIKEGDLVKMTVKARDLDNDALTFTYSDFFTETRKWQEGGFWYSEATWQTASGSRGHYTIRVTVTDPTSLTDTSSVLVNIGNFNHAPVLNPIPDITAGEGDTVVITPSATDSDNDAIFFYYASPFDTAGKWLTDYDSAGTYTVRVTASDGIDTVSQNAKVTINNTNRPPQVNLTLSRYTVPPNEVFSVTISATDPDADSMTFSLKKDGAEIASGSIVETYTTTTSFSTLGDHELSATVTDAGGRSTTETKGVDVADPNAQRDAINPVMGDFNGDALSDLGLHDSTTGKWEICLSDKGVFRNAVDWLSGFGASRDWWPMGGDFNGDGKTDAAVYNNLTGELKVALSGGSGFSSPSTWLTFSEASATWQPFSGNFNADKYTDFAVYNKDSGEVRVALGTGTGFGAFTTWVTGFGSDYVAMAGDFNGDGLSDLCLFKKSSGEFRVGFSDSKAFVDGTNWISGFAVDKDALVSDFNNDGLTDVGYWDKSGGWYYAISTGNRFVDKGSWLSGFGTTSDESATTGDFDGNGVTDAATFDRDQLGINRWTTRLSTNKPADLLTEIDNGIGGKTQITYTYAALSDNAALPFPVYVASSTSLVNTAPADRAATYTQNFIFSGGYFDFTEREFRGFAKVKVTDPITNNYSETYFYQGKPDQDGALKGQIEKIISYDGNGKKISEAFNTYEVKKSGPAERFLGFPALVEQTTTIYEENLTYITTKDKYTYDNIGNPIEEISEGDTSKTGDEKSTATTFAQAYEVGFNRPLEAVLKDKDGQLVSKKNFEYDTKGNLVKDTLLISNPLTAEQANPQTQYSYDSFGNLVSTTNALGSVVTTDYETEFYTYPERITNSLGHTIQYVYEPKLGVVKSVTDTNAATSTTTYDSLGRVLEVKNALNQITTTYAYPDFNTKTTTNALGFFKTEYIDGLGRKYKTVSNGEDGTSSRNVSSEVFFNNRGLTEKESLAHYVDEDAAQISYIRYEYDIRGRVKKTISDFPGVSKDAESIITYVNPVYAEATDPQGHRRGTRKDVYGNILEVTEFTQGGVYHTYYEYDTQNNLLKTTDNLGNITQIFYDSIGRKLKMIDPDMGTWLYEYDLIGNLKKQTDAKGQLLEFQYDVLNRLTGKLANGQTSVTYFYDDSVKDNCIGRLSKVTDQSGSTEFFYDKLGREIKSTKTVDSTPYTIERTYDILDRLATLKYPDGENITYTYDTNSGLLEKVASTNNYVQDITYNAKGQIRTIKYGNNVQTNYTYGQDLRLSQILTQGSTALQNLNYVFDKNGNLTTLTDNLRSNIRTYGYDELDRLTEARNLPAPAGGYADFFYQYDSIGNMVYKSDLGTMTYGQNAGPHALTQAGGYTYQYDANGNMIVGKNKTLAYDSENRLLEVNESGIISSFVYDGDGGRVKKATGENSTIYIGSLFEKDSTGKTTKHIFAGANRVATVDSTNNKYFYHSDHLGSSNIITDQTGAQVQYCEYTPYGTLARNEGTDAVKHKFTGKELDSTGLYFYGARYYDPELGRFISADTIVQEPYNPQTLNRYSYCGNNPINYIDPTGHSFWKKFGSTLLSVLSIVAAPFSGGLSLALFAAGTIMGGVQAAQAGQFGAWAAGFVISMAIGIAIPTPNFGNLGMQVGVGALRGAAIGAIAGGIASVVGGGSFGDGALQGAIGGAAGGGLSAFAQSQQFRNWKGGNGFKTDAEVQKIQNKIADVQAMLDEGYAESGVEGQIKAANEAAAASISPENKSVLTPSSILGAAGNIAAAAGNKNAALALKTTGTILSPAGPAKLLGGMIGGKIGFHFGGQLGAAMGLRIGYGIFGTQGIMPGVTIGYFTGAVVGGILGATGLGNFFQRLDTPGAGELNYGEAI